MNDVFANVVPNLYERITITLKSGKSISRSGDLELQHDEQFISVLNGVERVFVAKSEIVSIEIEEIPEPIEMGNGIYP